MADVQQLASLEEHTATFSPVVRGLIIAIVVLVALVVFGSLVAAWVMRLTHHRFDANKASKCTQRQLMAAISRAEDHEALRKLLRRMDAVFQEANIRYWIIGGTLLGAVRDGGIIPWDDDADVGVLASEWRTARSGLNEIAQRHGVRFDSSWIGPSEKMRFRVDDATTDPQKRVFVDIFEFNDDAKRNNATLRPTSSYALVAFPTETWQPEEVFPLRRYRLRQLHGTAPEDDVDGVDLWGPAVYERYLEAKYPKWQTQVVVSRHDNATLLAPCAVHPDDVREIMRSLRSTK